MRVARAAPARRHPIATPPTAPPDSPFFVIVDSVGKAVAEFDPLLVIGKVGVFNETMGVVTTAELLGVPSGFTRFAGDVVGSGASRGAVEGVIKVRIVVALPSTVITVVT